MAFPCEKCGCCCKAVGRSDAYADLDRGDGACRYYDDATKLCRIYESRPLRCRVDAYYEAFLQGTITRDAYYRLNRAACRLLQGK